MSKKIILFFAGVVLFFGVKQGLTADLSKVLKDAEARYAKFEESIKDMTILQGVTIITPNGNMSQDVKSQKKGKRFRMEMKAEMPKSHDMPQGMGAMETIIIYDGNDMWMFSPFTGKKKLSNQEGGQYQMEKNWWEFISDKAEVTGTEDVNGMDCYTVIFKTGVGSPFTKMWLDKKNLLLVKAENKKAGTQDMVWINSDFRKIKGDWEIPYKTEMFMDGKLASTAVVKSVEIDKGIPDDLFDPNRVEAKSFNMEEMMKKMMQGQQQ